MISGFQEETAPLTDDEKVMAELIALGLENKVGVEMAVTSVFMIEAMRKIGYKLHGARVRKIINHLRLTKRVTHLVSTSKGYYRTFDKADLYRYVESLRQRASAINAVADSFKDYLLPEQQTNLFK